MFTLEEHRQFESLYKTVLVPIIEGEVLTAESPFQLGQLGPIIVVVVLSLNIVYFLTDDLLLSLVS